MIEKMGFLGEEDPSTELLKGHGEDYPSLLRREEVCPEPPQDDPLWDKTSEDLGEGI